MDNSGAQTASRMQWPDPLRAMWLPPDGPELNPIERVWRDLKDDLAWQQLVTLEAQQDCGADLWQTSDARPLQSLTRDTSVVDAIHALCA